MSKRIHRMLAAIAMWSIVGSSSALLAQVAPPRVPPTPVPPAQPPATAQPAATAQPQDYRAKQILGTKVNIQGNIAIGTVDDIVFSDDGRIEYLLVLNDGKYVSVPWTAATFNFANQIATVNITQEQYRVIPTFTSRLLPRFYAPEYRVQTYKYYGLTPGQERRVERREERPR
jgi:PRC-barrel domain